MLLGETMFFRIYDFYYLMMEDEEEEERNGGCDAMYLGVV